jgi:hypothetical protein
LFWINRKENKELPLTDLFCKHPSSIVHRKWKKVLFLFFVSRIFFKKVGNIGIRCEGLVGPLVVTPRHPDVKSFYFEFLKFPLFPKPYQVGV